MFKSIVQRLLVVITIVFSSPPFLFAEHSHKQQTLYKKLEQHCIANVQWEDEDWPNEEMYEHLMRCIRYQKEPQEARKLRTAFKIFCSSKEQEGLVASAVLEDTTTWSDLCLFAGTHDVNASLLAIINRTVTKLGQVTLSAMIAQPITNITELEQRQHIIQELIDHPALLERLDKALRAFAACENLVMSFWAHDNLQQAAKRHYYDFTILGDMNATLNQNVLALDVKSFLEHNKRIFLFLSTAVASVVLPIYAASLLTPAQLPKEFKNLARYLRGAGGPMFAILSMLRNKWVQGITTGLAGSFCVLTAKEEYQWARDNIVLDMLLQEKLMACETCIHTISKVADTIGSTPVLKKGLPHSDAFFDFLVERPDYSSKLKRLFELLNTATFKGQPAALSRSGHILVAYNLMHETKDEWVDVLSALGELDAYVSIAKLYKEFEHKQARYCFVQFKKGGKPSIALQSFWNPFIRGDHVIATSIALGSDAESQNIILTGPNAGGKSTILRAIAINLILAQSFGIAPASKVVITPFSTIATYLNITDDINTGTSLFKAEVLRAHCVIDKVRSLSADNFSFIIVDEMFNGTSAKEGQAAAFSVAKHLGTYHNNICIIATHYPLLTQLADQSNVYANYKVTVEFDANGAIHYPFTLQRGASDQHIAIDILKAEGFASSVLDDAYALVKEKDL